MRTIGFARFYARSYSCIVDDMDFQDYEGYGARPYRRGMPIDRRDPDEETYGGALGAALPCWLNIALIVALTIVIVLAVRHLYKCWSGKKKHHHSTGYVPTTFSTGGGYVGGGGVPTTFSPSGGKEGFCCGA